MQDLDKFKNEMNLSGKNVYVGHRYVPKIMGDWDNSKLYEPLSVVTYQGASYTSRQYVPTGVEITNEDFWVLSGNYNAQVEHYRQEVSNVKNEVVNARNGEANLKARLDKENKEVKSDINNVKNEVVNARNGEANLKARLDKENQEVNTQLAQITTGKRELDDAVGEWWTTPLATHQTTPYSRTVMGAVSKTGRILALEQNHTTGKTSRYEVAQAGANDHNVPAIHVSEGCRPIIAWTRHNSDTIIRFKVGGLNGDIGYFQQNPEIQVDVEVRTSYTQIYKIEHMSNEEETFYFTFFRADQTQWRAIKFKVTEKTGTFELVSFVNDLPLSGRYTAGRTLVESPTNQCYLSSAESVNGEGDQIIRFAFGYNPAQPVHSVYAFELNVKNGDITSLFDHSILANIKYGTRLPLRDDSMESMIPDVGAGKSRRLFYVRGGQDSFAVAYADWDIGDESNAIYKVDEVTSFSETPSTPAPHNGLIPSGGYVTSDKKITLPTQGFEYVVNYKAPSTPVEYEIGRIYSSTQTSLFYLRVHADGSFTMNFNTTEGIQVFEKMPTPLADKWGSDVWFKMKFDFPNSVVRRYLSDDGKTWEEIGEGIGLDKVYEFAPYSDVFTLPSHNANFSGVPVFYSFKFASLSGTTLSDVNFKETWTPYNSNYKDSNGNTFTTSGGAYIGRTNVPRPPVVTPVTTTYEFGVSGEKIGYTDASNYIPGMNFEQPSNGEIVYTAHNVDGVQLARKWRKIGNRYVPERIYEQTTEHGKLCRPYSPLNSYGANLMLTNFTKYDGYTNFEGNIITI